MARRIVNLPGSVEALAREMAEEAESFSATVARLIEEAARAGAGSARLDRSSACSTSSR